MLFESKMAILNDVDSDLLVYLMNAPRDSDDDDFDDYDDDDDEIEDDPEDDEDFEGEEGFDEDFID